MTNPFLNFKKHDYIIWIASIIVILVSNVVPGNVDILTLTAALIGVTSLIFAAKGNVWAQALIIVFSIIYGIISWRFRYYGEMITYLGMTMPMAVWSMITWLKNPSQEAGVVAIRRMDAGLWVKSGLAVAVVTGAFYYILEYFETPNIVFSTLSVTTSFWAVTLTMLRTSYFALFYAMNDVVLIVLWVLATLDSIAYLPVVVIFVIFLFNDIYGFVSWYRRENATGSCQE